MGVKLKIIENVVFLVEKVNLFFAGVALNGVLSEIGFTGVALIGVLQKK